MANEESCLISDNYNCKYCEYAGKFCDGPGLVKHSPDSNVEKNRELLLQRSIVGLQKYGVTTCKANLTQKEWLRHALEEALDLANYLQAEISRAEAEESESEQVGCDPVKIESWFDSNIDRFPAGSARLVCEFIMKMSCGTFNHDR